jgi:multisite-specific tRNA:(cytosine-C5)-methyltransferase
VHVRWLIFLFETLETDSACCRKQLNLDTHFPASNVLVRNPEGDAVRSLYLTNDVIKAIVQNNDYARLRIINSGTKVFTKQEGGRGIDASFRVLGEGLPVVLPYIDPTTILDGDIEILKTLISVYYPLCGTFPEPFKSVIEARGKSF